MSHVQYSSQARAGSQAGWLAPARPAPAGHAARSIAGAFRLSQLSGMSDAMPVNPRFTPMPLPVVLHIVSATVFAILGPLQFAAGFRRRWPAWHRVAGRLLVGCGLLVGLTGLWMTLFYAPPDNSGPLLYASRIVFGSAMVVSIVYRPRRDPAQERPGSPCVDGARVRDRPWRRDADAGADGGRNRRRPAE